MNNIKEALSKKFVEIIVYRLGHKVAPILEDDGVDFIIREVAIRKKNDGSLRRCDSGRTIEVQMKSTTEGKIRIDNEFVTYTCEKKTYNDLISRKDDLRPLVLLLFILPEDEDEWIEHLENQLIIRKHVYWYVPKQDDQTTSNNSSINIKIPKINVFSKESLIQLFDYTYQD